VKKKTPLEKEVKKKLRAWADKNKIYRIPVLCAARGGKRGKPDDIFCIQGLFVTIEGKREGKDLTPLQEESREKILESGGLHTTLYFNTWDEVRPLLELLLDVHPDDLLVQSVYIQHLLDKICAASDLGRNKG
jgi:hypothetical protein